MPKNKKKKVASVTSAAKSGLVLAPSRFHNRLLAGNYAPRLSTTIHVYSAAMMQTILRMVLESSAERCTAQKKSTINREHIHAAIRETPNLSALFEGIDMHDMIVARHVSPALLNKPKSRRKRAKKAVK